MFLEPRRAPDRWTVALDLAVYRRQTVGGLTDPQHRLKARSVGDNEISVNIGPKLAARFAK